LEIKLFIDCTSFLRNPIHLLVGLQLTDNERYPAGRVYDRVRAQLVFIRLIVEKNIRFDFVPKPVPV
jgi:hypothetical protein